MERLINEMSVNNSKFGEIIAKLVLAELKSFHKDMKEEMVELRKSFKNLSMKSCCFDKKTNSPDTLEDNACNGLNHNHIIQPLPSQEDVTKDDEEDSVSSIHNNDVVSDILDVVDVSQLWPNVGENGEIKYILESVAGPIKPVEINPVKHEVADDTPVFFATSGMFSSQLEFINSNTTKAEYELEDNNDNQFNAPEKDCEFVSNSVENSDMNLQHVQEHKTDEATSTIQRTIPLPPAKKRFTCKICKKEFQYPGSLKQHMPIHTGERPYGCTHCGKTFARKGVAKIHMVTHSEERPYVCNVCGKSFKLKHNLKEHVLIHTGEKPRKCELCEKSFTSFGALRSHQLIHKRPQPTSTSKS